MTRNTFVGPVLLALFVALASGCTGDGADEPRVVQPGAPGEPSRELTAQELDELDVQPPAHNEADVAFMQGMLVHHAQALDMTALVPDRAAREDLPLFAERMEISQRDEMDLITSWLEARDETVPDLDDEHAHHGHAELMPGMLTDEELAQLEAASGPAFDRLFLVFMTHHHEGALEMVSDLFAAGGGQEPEVFAFANHVDADQRVELARMAEMLAELED